MKVQKRHIVLAALVVALGAAVYINWQFSGTPDSLISKTSKELGAATYVNAEGSSKDQVLSVSKSTDESSNYFAKAELQRQQSRDEAIDTAQNTIKLTDSSEETKTKAVEQLNKIEDNIVKESNIEALIKAKGMTKCLCYISDKGCTVTVLKKELQKNSPLIIKDIVLSQLDIDFNSITIVDV